MDRARAPYGSVSRFTPSAIRQAQVDGFNTPYLQEQLDTANKAVSAGKDKPIGSTPPIGLIVGGAVLIVLLAAAGGVVLMVKGRRKPGPGTSGGEASGMALLGRHYLVGLRRGQRSDRHRSPLSFQLPSIDCGLGDGSAEDN